MADETTPIPQTPPIDAPTEEPIQAPEPQTAQIPPNEPLAPEPEPIEETEIPEAEPVEKPQPTPAPQEQSAPVIIVPPPQNKLRELLARAQFAIQTRKQKKKDKIMTLFLKKQNITNDEVEKLLHVSDATATRYLSALEKDGKIKQNSKTGKGVSYSKI